jgi:hypothetical protein
MNRREPLSFIAGGESSFSTESTSQLKRRRCGAGFSPTFGRLQGHPPTDEVLPVSLREQLIEPVPESPAVLEHEAQIVVTPRGVVQPDADGSGVQVVCEADERFCVCRDVFVTMSHAASLSISPGR